MWGALYEYLAALWQHWTWFVTGGPFLFDRIAKNHPAYEDWIKRWLGPTLRLRITVGAWIAGIFIASFLAFSDERQQVIGAKSLLKNMGGEVSYDPIPEWKLAILRKEIAGADKSTKVIVAYGGNWSTAMVASEIGKAVGVEPILGYVDAPYEFGIRLDVKNPLNIDPKVKTYIDALNKSEIEYHIIQETNSTFTRGGWDLGIFVAPRAP